MSRTDDHRTAREWLERQQITIWPGHWNTTIDDLAKLITAVRSEEQQACETLLQEYADHLEEHCAGDDSVCVAINCAHLVRQRIWR